MIKHFNNILDLINHIEPNNPVVERYEKGGIIGINNTNFRLFAHRDKFIILPMSGFFNRYYRGENKQYTECKSSFSRLDEFNKKIFSIKQLEFIYTIKQMPEVVFAENDHHLVDYDALIQHYGLYSKGIDLTSNLAVAAFFATNRYDSLTNTYLPVDKGKGYIWFYDYHYNYSEIDNKLRLTGLQPFKRPQEQHAFSFHLDDNEDFYKHAHKISFKQNKTMSELIRSLFIDKNGNNILFPKEEVGDFARSLIKEQSLWIVAVDEYNKQNNIKYDEIFFKKYNYKIRTTPLLTVNKKSFELRMKELEKDAFDGVSVTSRLSYRPLKKG